ncbi:MAG: AAA family ATPase [Selenomonadaceae bacterium]|nr:AAA family ATPase [Selenomonadaceae bacterium]
MVENENLQDLLKPEERRQEEINLDNLEKELDRKIEEDLDAHIDQLDISFYTDYNNVPDVKKVIDNCTSSDREALFYKALKYSPYFGRIDIQSDGEDYEETYYIGYHTIRDKYDECIVIEWQSPMASLYYSKEQKIFKMKNGEVIELKLLRQLRIENEKVVAGATLVGGEEDFLDGEIIDPFLLTILKDKRRNKYLTDIIQSIQSNQNDIIRMPEKDSFIVQGCAGSGKTMILLHRLSVLQFNNNNLPLNKIKILTPNSDFNLYINNLSLSLGLNKIERISVDDYYINLIKKYSHEIQIDSNISSEEELDKNLLSKLYSQEFTDKCIDDFSNYYSKIVSDIKNCNYQILVDKCEINFPEINGSMDNIYKKLNLFIENVTTWIHDNDNKIKRYELIIQENSSEIKRLSQIIPNMTQELIVLKERTIQEIAKEILSYMMEKLEFEAIIEREKNSKNRYIIDKSKLTQQYFGNHNNIEYIQQLEIINSTINGITKKINALQRNMQEDIVDNIRYINDCLKVLCNKESKLPDIRKIRRPKNYSGKHKHMQAIAEYKRKYNQLEEINEENKRITRYIPMNKLLKKRLETFNLKKNELKEFDSLVKINNQMRESEAYRINFLMNIRNAYKEYNTLYTTLNYRFKLYFRLLFYNLYYDKSFIVDRFVYIDEAQDISVVEYRLLRKILGNDCVFNLYGDTRQLIYDYKGIRDWSVLSDVVTHNIYYLKENYRNTNQITEFCNHKFNCNITSIGIDGHPVETTDFSSALMTMKLYRKQHPDARCAIICKDINKVGKAVSEVFNDISLGKLVKGRIVVLGTEQAKGMEFEVVIVVENGMNENEKYVSCTRALESLIIAK